MSKNIFNSIKLPKVASNNFDLSHDVKMSFRMGMLVPSFYSDTIPGDVFNINCENMLRFAPLISPVMHRVDITTHYFFVPNRLLWKEWEKWIVNDSDVEAPYISLAGATVMKGSYCDYFGVPLGEYPATSTVRISPLMFAAYDLIYKEYYRDQNLYPDDSNFPEIVPGDNTATWLEYVAQQEMWYRNWEHDYFTGCLPFAQKGDSVQVPLTVAENVPVEFDPNGKPVSFVNPNTGADLAAGSVSQAAGPSPFGTSAHVGTNPAALDPRGTLVVDVQSDAVDINTLRRAFRLQEWLERNARGGTRYIENILSQFGVKSSDSRLQRPEYLGGMKQRMVISEVLATAENTEAVVPVGQMAGHGISVGGSRNVKYRCEEHGFVIGLISVMPKTAYQDGIHKMHMRFDRFDYAWPVFANLGEQEVRQKEIFARTTQDPEKVFGYAPRYAEYKFLNSRVAGEMQTSLDFWHLGRRFADGDEPELNAAFVECRPSDRIFAVTDPTVDHIYAHIFNNVRVTRRLPRFGIPSI